MNANRSCFVACSTNGMRQRSNDEFDDLPSPMTMVTIMGGTWVLTVSTQGLARGQ